MRFDTKYTSDEKKGKDNLKDIKDQTEQSKTVLTDDAFAITEALAELNATITRVGFR